MDNSYNIIKIQQYLKGELNEEEMHTLERAALDDPFLNDALEGYQHHGVQMGKLTRLQRRLHDRFTTQPLERSQLLFTSQRLGVAAVACLLVLLACLLLWMVKAKNSNPTQEQQVAIELNTSEPIPSGNGGLSIARKLTALSASPQLGWDTLNSYIKKNIPPLSGKDVVVLSFETDETGKPINIHALKGSLAFTQEVTKLLEKGPLWEVKKRGQVEFVFGEN